MLYTVGGTVNVAASAGWGGHVLAAARHCGVHAVVCIWVSVGTLPGVGCSIAVEGDDVGEGEWVQRNSCRGAASYCGWLVLLRWCVQVHRHTEAACPASQQVARRRWHVGACVH